MLKGSPHLYGLFMITPWQFVVDTPDISVVAWAPTFSIATLGSSLTAGFGTPDGFVLGGWQDDLQHALASPLWRVRVYNNGQPGASSAIGFTDKLPEVIAAQPQVCLIEYMINDSLGISVPPGMSEAASTQKHKDIINAIKSGSPDTLIYLMTMSPVLPSAAIQRPNLTTYNSIYSVLAVSESVGSINNYPLYSGVTTDDLPDGVHPTQACQRAILIPSLVAVIAPLMI